MLRKVVEIVQRAQVPSQPLAAPALQRGHTAAAAERRRRWGFRRCYRRCRRRVLRPAATRWELTVTLWLRTCGLVLVLVAAEEVRELVVQRPAVHRTASPRARRDRSPRVQPPVPAASASAPLAPPPFAAAAVLSGSGRVAALDL